MKAILVYSHPFQITNQHKIQLQRDYYQLVGFSGYGINVS